MVVHRAELLVQAGVFGFVEAQQLVAFSEVPKQWHVLVCLFRTALGLLRSVS